MSVLATAREDGRNRAGSFATPPKKGRTRSRRGSELHHVEVGFGRAAGGAGPVVGDGFPARARGDVAVGVADRLVIDPAAGPALEGPVGFGHAGLRRSGAPMVGRPEPLVE